MLKFKDYVQLSAEERLEVFLETLSKTNRTPEYYVNWDKVVRETKRFELHLNTLNYLIGKSNIREEATKLFISQPHLIEALPSLIASREKIIDVLKIDSEDNMSFETLDFVNVDSDRIIEYVDFAEQSGLLYFLKNEANRSLVDYVYGVETGLDSNARKNRSGTTMEGVLERSVDRVCKEYGLEFKAQATAPSMKEDWGVEIPVDKSTRRFDVAVYSRTLHKVWLIETNYYGGGGSKLKSVSGEFTELSQFVTRGQDNIQFVWVTDGQGWKTARLPLLEAFGYITYVFNLEMLKEGYLFELFK